MDLLHGVESFLCPKDRRRDESRTFPLPDGATRLSYEGTHFSYLVGSDHLPQDCFFVLAVWCFYFAPCALRGKELLSIDGISSVSVFSPGIQRLCILVVPLLKPTEGLCPIREPRNKGTLFNWVHTLSLPMGLFSFRVVGGRIVLCCLSSLCLIRWLRSCRGTSVTMLPI